MIGRFHPFGSRQFTCESFRVVDEHRKVLRTNPELLISVIKSYQRNLRVVAFTCNASRFGELSCSHGVFSMFVYV